MIEILLFNDFFNCVQHAHLIFFPLIQNVTQITNRVLVLQFNFQNSAKLNVENAFCFVCETLESSDIDEDAVKQKLNLLERRAKHLWKKNEQR